MTYEDITIEYNSFERLTPTSDAGFDFRLLHCRGYEFFIAELVKTPEGKILIPPFGSDDANLFVVMGGTNVLSVVSEFPDYAAAAKLLDEAEAQGAYVMRGHDTLPGVRWFASFKPTSAGTYFPWLSNALTWLPPEKRSYAR